MRSPLLKHTYRQREGERYSRWQLDQEQGSKGIRDEQPAARKGAKETEDWGIWMTPCGQQPQGTERQGGLGSAQKDLRTKGPKGVREF